MRQPGAQICPGIGCPGQNGGGATCQGIFLDVRPPLSARHGGRISKLIDSKGMKIHGYQAPLTVAGPPELLRIGYACGFGDRNSQGVGMVEMARQDAPQTP